MTHTAIMTKRLLIIALLAVATQALWAASHSQALSDDDKQRWLSEVRSYRNDYLAKELALSKDQQKDFFPIYEEMDEAITAIGDETRALVRKVQADENASDTEIESAARALYELKAKEGESELKYFDKLKSILTPKQLLKLKNAERKFTQQLVKQHRRIGDRKAGK